MGDIKITKDCYLPYEQVRFYTSYQSHAIQTVVRRLRKEGKVYDLTGGKKILAVIFLLSGEVILVSTSPDTLAGRRGEIKKKG